MASLLTHTLRMISYGAVSRRSSIPNSWRKLLAQPASSYGLSCFAYTAVGLHAIALWATCPAAFPDWPAKIAIPEASLVSLQGVWSFCSDVLFVGRESGFHAVDRVSALSLTALQIAKFSLLLTLSSYEKLWVCTGIVAGLGCKLRGYRAILDGSAEGFRRAHIWWHLSLPLVIGTLHAVRQGSRCL